MARVRVLNVSNITVGLLTVTPPPPTVSWDFEIDQEPLFSKRATAQLLPISALVPLPRVVPAGWSVSAEPRFIRPKVAARMPVVSVVPLPSVTLTTTLASAPGTFTLVFASVPASVVIGMVVIDVTSTSVIPVGTTVIGKSATNVTCSAVFTGAGVALGDRINFTY